MLTTATATGYAPFGCTTTGSRRRARRQLESVEEPQQSRKKKLARTGTESQKKPKGDSKSRRSSVVGGSLFNDDNICQDLDGLLVDFGECQEAGAAAAAEGSSSSTSDASQSSELTMDGIVDICDGLEGVTTPILNSAAVATNRNSPSRRCQREEVHAVSLQEFRVNSDSATLEILGSVGEDMPIFSETSVMLTPRPFRRGSLPPSSPSVASAALVSGAGGTPRPSAAAGLRVEGSDLRNGDECNNNNDDDDDDDDTADDKVENQPLPRRMTNANIYQSSSVSATRRTSVDELERITAVPGWECQFMDSQAESPRQWSPSHPSQVAAPDPGWKFRVCEKKLRARLAAVAAEESETTSDNCPAQPPAANCRFAGGSVTTSAKAPAPEAAGSIFEMRTPNRR